MAASYDCSNREIKPSQGAAGVLNEQALEGALARPRNTFLYSNPTPDVISLAAVYAHGISKAHAFRDGNKRTAFYVCRIFLMENGYEFDPPTEEAIAFFVHVADDTHSGLTHDDMVAWLRRFAAPQKSPATVK